MSRRPRDPFDPFGNDNNSSPFGGFDPFNDPFFKQFEKIHQHMFRDLFGGEDDSPNSLHSQTPNNNHNAPDLSQINPNAPPNSNNKNANNNNNYSNRTRTTAPSFFRMFDHFFEPEYDDHKLSDINPNLSDNGPIMNNENDNKGLIHPHGTPPGFRSPYLPNSTGAEKNMEFSNNNNGSPNTYYRSQSVVISTGPNGKTTKTTTIRDSNGETTTTQEFDANDNMNNNHNDIRSIFNWGFNHNHNEYDNENGKDRMIELFPNQKDYPLFERTHDPLEAFRSKWQNWRWNPYNWNKQNSGSGHDGNDEYTNRNNNRNKNDGIKWQSYQDYNHKNKGPSLLDDIVKKNDNDK